MVAMRWSLLLFGLLGCGGKATGSGFETERADTEAGAVTTSRATWKYVSSEVDVTTSLVTERGVDYCTTRANLTIDKANASPDSYHLDETDCSVLALTDGGDIVLYDSPTGHDWSPEPLRVDTDQELVELGPWTPAEPSALTYRFTLAAPPCGGDCSCPFLRRRAGSEDLVLELARDCE
jgi:hypothetical protein